MYYSISKAMIDHGLAACRIPIPDFDAVRKVRAQGIHNDVSGKSHSAPEQL